VSEVVEFAKSLPFVSVVRDYKFMCSDPGQELIKEDVRNGFVDRVVVASCSPLMHEGTFRKAVEEAGLNRFLFQMANIREQVSWVTQDPGKATEKAKALVAGAVRRVVFHEALEIKRIPVVPSVLIVGGGIAGIEAALKIAEAGKQVFLVEREPSIGGHMAKFDKCFPTLDCAACILTPKMTQVRMHPNIKLFSYSEVESVEPYNVRNFKVKIRRKARYVREDLCTGCGLCAEVCPVTVPSEFDEGLGVRKAIYKPFPQAVPNVFTISRRGMSPCQAGCPIHQNAYGYISLIAKGKFKEALDVILMDNPLPSICGRVCSHPCMLNCTRNNYDQPINIPALKRFITDMFPDYKLPRPEVEHTERIAIVGSGPAGLMCAYELRKRGYQPVIYEAMPVPGGMLSIGIPEFRLPKKIVQAEIERLIEIGVEIRTNTFVGKDITLEELRKQYQAVFIAIGAGVERKLNIPGEDLPGVWGGIEFLRKVNLEGPFRIGGRVLVIGGGNSAIDAARTAIRCGAKEVTIVYRRTKAEMPAFPEEIEQAEKEGVKFIFLASPKSILGNKESGVTGLECVRMRLGGLDETGRPSPIPIPGTEFVIECDAIIVTIGQYPDIKSLGDKLGIETTKWGTFKVDELTLETNIPGVFAGGDCVNGPDVIINAMCAGKKAAISIDRYLRGLDLREGRELEGSFKPSYEVPVNKIHLENQVPVPIVEPELYETFEEVHRSYTPEMAMREAQRCLNCAICCDCRLCATVCEAKAIDYSMKDEIEEVIVGAIILATGFKTFDPRRIPRYGYGKYPNVFTSLEIERMTNSAGPTGGEILLRDARKPKSVGIIHCVGSRDKNYNWYCSRVCCLYSLKLAHLIKERTGAEVYNFYIDMRTAGKAYEEFYDRALSEGIRFVRGRVAEVTDHAMTPEEEGKLIIRVEDTLIGVVRRIPVDLVVLSVGLEPREDADEVRKKFSISCSKEGWFLERHPKLAPVSTFTDGIYIAGACQGPKDIQDTVAQAGAAAAEVLSLFDKGFVEVEPSTAFIREELCSGCKTCISVCPFNAISFNVGKGISEINEGLCKGCGTCAAACPSGAIKQNLFTDDEILQEIEGVLIYV